MLCGWKTGIATWSIGCGVGSVGWGRCVPVHGLASKQHVLAEAGPRKPKVTLLSLEMPRNSGIPIVTVVACTGLAPHSTVITSMKSVSFRDWILGNSEHAQI